ncbi:general secretion pathway protein K [Methylobacterium sp. 174MFSha1.1]|uniref:general secretion pathway protein GspK n=1 Tax=Methylobacterium sp. 174MFSha1.1 TaxID=1502749 RepID=UPI0008F16C51|nr:type II secretion system protein GspK [Methylobacterium sp. 174MFSha1.1]SFU48926.1 general secretion pathway protein K [Methylobacterium sp. 174MFSha1.1]
MSRASPHCAAEAGFVLPAVLALLLVVAAAAATAVQALQSRSATTTGRSASLRLQGLADGTVRLAAMALVVQHVRKQPGLGLPENGAPVACPLADGGVLALAVQDQAGLVDLNASPRPLMEDAFRALGVPDRAAAALAAEIVDARDPDDVPEPNGAEEPQYRARGLPGPRNAPLPTIDEIDGLPSMTEALAARLRPAVTVHNPGGGIDLAAAPLGALTGTALTEGLTRYAVRSPHQAFAITAVASGPGGARAGRSAILSVGAPGGTGLVAWRFTTAMAPAAAHPACGLILAALDPP